MSQPRPSKKDVERWYLDRFRESYDGFPEGEPVDGERPDFRILGQRTIGIELTRLFHEHDGNGRPLQEIEQLRRIAVSQAEKLYNATGGPILDVAVQFVNHAILSKATTPQVAAKLAALVKGTTVADQSHVFLEYDWLNRDVFPEELSWVRIARFSQIHRSHWSPVNAGHVPDISPEHLQASIDSKRNDAAVHRTQCQEAWLVVVADGFGISSTFTFTEEAQSHLYTSPFDRTVFFENFSRRAYRLNTTSPSAPTGPTST